MRFSEYYKNKEVAESYERKRSRGLKSKVVRELERKAIEALLKGTGKDILEAGVGTGFITEVLQKHGKVSGFDISPAMIKRAKKKFPKISIKKDNILNLKIRKKYGTIASVRVISHFKQKEAEKALKNLKSVTKKRGHVIFNLENKSLARRILRKIRRWGSTKTYQYSSSDIENLMKKTGLKLKDEVYVDHLFLLPLHILNKLLFNSIEKPLIRLELKLSKVRFMSNNTFIKCQK